MPRFPAAIVFAILATASAAWALSDQHIRFTTYLRQGPDRSYRVIDEAQTGQSVRVESCANNWCRVRLGGADGYVAQTALTPTAQAAAGPGRCLMAAQAGYHGREPLQLCNRAAAR